ncbi:MAG: EamA family transporter [Alphaproteobacteria bacterium]|nr:EamA family transporter [Alphaproteobacteria bacterium]
MNITQICFAVSTIVIWGLGFVVYKHDLATVPPWFLAFLTVSFAAIPCIWVKRPPVPRWQILLGGMTLLVGQFGLTFLAISYGLPIVLVAATVQSQMFFTIILTAYFVRQMPSHLVIAGEIFGVIGLGMIGHSLMQADCSVPSGSHPFLGFCLSLAAGLCWAIGNITVIRMGQVKATASLVWMSLYAILPLAVLSIVFDGTAAIFTVFDEMDSKLLLSILYGAVAVTLLSFGIWSKILQRYSLAIMSCFSFFVLAMALFAATYMLGEGMTDMQMIGVAAIMVGMLMIVINPRFVRQS